MNKFTFSILALLTGISFSSTNVFLSPEKADVLEGGSVLLTCSGNFSDTSDTSVIWYLRKLNYNYVGSADCDNIGCNATGFLNDSMSYAVYLNGTSTVSVLLRNVNRSSHNELWRCEQGFISSNYAIISVKVPVVSVRIEPMDTIISTNENTSVNFSCLTSFGRPAPNVTWYLKFGTENDIPLLDSNSTQITNRTEDMFATKSDIVLYVNRTLNGSFIYCSARNIAGLTVYSERILLNVKYPPDGPPEILNYANGSTYTVVENRQGSLSCSVRGGNPYPSVTWDCFNGRTETIAYNNYVTERVTWTASRDQIRPCTCTSEHMFTGKEIASVSIDIIYIAKVTSFYVKGFKGQDLITVTENDTVQFTCLIDTAASDAKLTFQWKTVLFEDSNTSNLTYSLRQVTCLDAGDYNCFGRNTYNYGKPSIGHLTLLVLCPPQIHPNKPIKENVVAKPGDTIIFNVEIISYPEPLSSDYVWMKQTNANWSLLENTSQKEISTKGLQTNLTIKSVTEEDYGNYRLTVVNELGAYSQTFSLERVKSQKNVTGIVIGSVVGILVFIGIICAIIYIRRKYHNKSDFQCNTFITTCVRRCPPISSIMQYKKEKKTSSCRKSLSSKVAETKLQEPTNSETKNTYEAFQRNGEIEEEYQQIQPEDDDNCLYKNVEPNQQSARS